MTRLNLSTALRARGHRGFALLLTLVLLLIAAIALTVLARQSVTEALASREATEELQRRWAVNSCRATLLPRAGKVLSAHDASAGVRGAASPSRNQPVERRADLWVRCTLAGIDYDLVLTDEQAKFNPTVMQGVAAPGSVAPSLERLTEQTGGIASQRVNPISLRPLVGLDNDGSPAEPPPGTAGKPMLYAGYGQVFADASPAMLLGRQDRPGPASRITCWGDGKVNLRRAPIGVVEEAMRPLLDQRDTRALLLARDDPERRGLAGWLGAAQSSPPVARSQAERLLTDQSRCQGLWVVARGKTRSWYTFSVLEFRPPTDGAVGLQGLAGRPAQPAPPDPEPQKPALRRYDYAW